MTVFAALSFAASGWGLVVIVAAAVLIALAWIAWRRRGAATGAMAVGMALRALGIALLLLCLLEPQQVTSRPKRGENVFAVLADNSRSLEVTETGEPGSRGARMRALVTGEGAQWLTELKENFQVRTYQFDRDLKRTVDFAALDFHGDATALGAALKGVRERFAGQPLAGVVVFTDGNATDLPDGLPDLSGLPPVYPVAMGNAGRIRDVRIERVDVRQTMFDDAPVTLRAGVAAGGMTGTAVAVRVREIATEEAGKLLAGGAAASATAKAGAEPVAQTVTLGDNAAPSETTFTWHPEGTGAKFFEVSAEPAEGTAEATGANNRRTVMIDRGRAAYRILYVGGRPSWEYKFLNRALADDPQLQLVGLIRVARREPKFEFKGRAGEANNPLFRGFGRGEDETVRYDQPVLVRANARDEYELRGGFPVTAEELFAYDALVIDDVEAAFFNLEQQALLRRFASERGGGLLMLGGADSLDQGGYRDTPLAAALPVYLDRAGEAPVDGEFKWSLTREGWLAPWVRVAAAETSERERLARMPAFRVLNGMSAVKPGATVLTTVEDGNGNVYPGLVAQNFGAGRVASVAVGDLWRWGLRGEEEQKDLAKWWRQIARWLVTDAPPQVGLSVEPAGEGEGMRLRVTARDKAFKPLDLANVKISIRRLNTEAAADDGGRGAMATAAASEKDAKAGAQTAGADGGAGGALASGTTGGEKRASANGGGFTQVDLVAEPEANAAGKFVASLASRDPGAYLAEAEVTDGTGQIVGRAKTGWVQDPVADEFRSLEPNRALLEELARRTGGRVVEPAGLGELAKALPAMAAPIMETRARPLWHQSAVLLAMLACFLAEWIWRRWKGLP